SSKITTFSPIPSIFFVLSPKPRDLACNVTNFLQGNAAKTLILHHAEIHGQGTGDSGDRSGNGHIGVWNHTGNRQAAVVGELGDCQPGSPFGPWIETSADFPENNGAHRTLSAGLYGP